MHYIFNEDMVIAKLYVVHLKKKSLQLSFFFFFFAGGLYLLIFSIQLLDS